MNFTKKGPINSNKEANSNSDETHEEPTSSTINKNKVKLHRNEGSHVIKAMRVKQKKKKHKESETIHKTQGGK